MTGDREGREADSARLAAADAGVLTPTAVAGRIREALGAVGAGVVEGEVTASHTSGKGHRYFTLSDGRATVDCFTWEDARAEVDPYLREGETVRAHFTKVGYMDRSAKVSLTVDRVRPVGEGEILREMAAVLARLVGEGLTDPARKRPLPAFPRAIGVVAGQGSDAMADVVTAVRERFPPARVRTMPAVVEGVGTVDSVIAALARLLREPEIDVVVVARGGGSVESLRPFSDERLCRAIAAFPRPVVTSIGHTKQRPNCDHVADASADVPRAVAELVVPSAVDLRGRLAAAGTTFARVERRVEITVERLVLVAGALSGAGERRVGRATGGLAEVAARLERLRHRLPASSDLDAALGVVRSEGRRIADAIGAARLHLERSGVAIRAAAASALADRRDRLRSAAAPLHERDGLEHGYAMVLGADERPIASVRALAPGADVSIRFADGRARARITALDPEDAT